MREFAFELAVCSALEAESDGIVARQLGTRDRIVDVVELRPGPDFETRPTITAEPLPPLAIESDVSVGTARYWKDAIDDPDGRGREAVERAIERGFFEAERRNGRRYVRQTVRYPDWIGGLRAIENKPDLGRPGDLELQLRKDVSLALFDEVVLVTASYVTGAHLNRIPDPVGVVRFDPETGDRETIRNAERLPVEETGIAVRDVGPTRADVEPIGADEKARLRRRIAERAYGKGWRPRRFPNCAKAERGGPAFRTDDALPYCGWKGRLVDPTRECGVDCQGHDPADPPAVDVDAHRAARTPWEPDPAGTERRQVGLDFYS